MDFRLFKGLEFNPTGYGHRNNPMNEQRHKTNERGGIFNLDTIEKIGKRIYNLTYLAYSYTHDYALVLSLKSFHKGCNPVLKQDKIVCGISRKFYHKHLVSLLCKSGKPNLEKRIVKSSVYGTIYSYCLCNKNSETKDSEK